MKEKFLQMIQSVREKTTQVFIPFLKKTAQRLSGTFGLLIKKGGENAPLLKNGIKDFIVNWWRLCIALLLLIFILYYPAGALIVHDIDVDPDFGAQKSRPVPTIDTLAELIRRETDTNVFTPNKPFFHPSTLLDDMPAFQTGVITGIKNVTDILSVVNAQSENLTQAAERLAYPVSVWHVRNWKPAVSSDKKYNKAADLLKTYQKTSRKAGKLSINRKKRFFPSSKK